jgi:lipoprotein Spr
MRGAYRFTYLVIIILSFLIYFGCSSSSNTSRYGNNGDNDYDDNNGRFSSDEDERSITSNEDNYSWDESGDLPGDDEVDVSEIVDKYNSSDAEYNTNTTVREKMLMGILKYINTPYKYGGTSKKGIDCSAFTQNIYKSTLSTDLLRSARDQYTQGETVSNVDDLHFGDLVFFDTRSGVKPGHVGIYIGDELFAHASSKKGVTISSLNHSYYQSRFMGGRRIKPQGTFRKIYFAD